MLAICALLFLSSAIVDAKHLRSNDVLPLNVVFENEQGVGYSFVQDPLHPHKEDSIALQVSYRVDVVAAKSFYFCETKVVNRYREDNHIMIDSVNYEVSRHRKQQFLLLTATDGTVMKLTETSQTLNCMQDMVPEREFHIPYFTLVTTAPNNQLMGWTDSGAVDVVEYYSARTGAHASTGTLEPSSAATAACPDCTFLTGWDGEHLWLSNFGYLQQPSDDVRFVNIQTGSYLSWSLAYRILNTRVSKTYLLVQGENYGRYDWWYVYLHNKTDGSLHRKLRVPRVVGNAYNSCMGAFLSPDESRVLMVCECSYQGNQHRSLLLEMSADTGAVLKISTLPAISALGTIFGGNRYTANSIMVRANNEDIHMYKYSV